MRYLVYSETTLTGPGEQTVQLDQPAGEFQDTYVLAFPKIQAEKNQMAKDVSPFNMNEGEEFIIDVSGEEEITARSVVLEPGRMDFACDVEVSALQDGSYRSIRSFHVDRSKNTPNVGPATYAPIAFALPPARSGSFRIVCNNFQTGAQQAGFNRVTIGENAVLEEYMNKSMGKMHPTPFLEFDSYIWESQPEAEGENLTIMEPIDLSAQMDESGKLVWDVPEGEWTVIRMGMTPTGTKNHPAAPQGQGYEIDKATELDRRFRR
jgi:hypothetical protein